MKYKFFFLVFCGAARNRVVCRQRERPSTVGHIHPKTLKETQEAIKTLIASTKPATEEVSYYNVIDLLNVSFKLRKIL